MLLYAFYESDASRAIVQGTRVNLVEHTVVVWTIASRHFVKLKKHVVCIKYMQ